MNMVKKNDDYGSMNDYNKYSDQGANPTPEPAPEPRGKAVKTVVVGDKPYNPAEASAPKSNSAVCAALAEITSSVESIDKGSQDDSNKIRLLIQYLKEKAAGLEREYPQ